MLYLFYMMLSILALPVAMFILTIITNERRKKKTRKVIELEKQHHHARKNRGRTT